MVQGYIYRHWIINDEGVEKSYIGQTIQKPTRRWSDGKGYLYSHGKKINNKFSNAIEKYGWKNFSHEIIGIVESDTKEQLIRDLDEWEKYYIEKYDSFHNGYNSTTGGSNGLCSEETRKKISESTKGEKNPRYGKHHTEETRRKMSQAKQGVYNGEKNPLYGKHHTEETKRKISEKRQGKYHTEEAKRKMSEKRQGKTIEKKLKKVICITTGEIFDSIKDAQEKYNLFDISKCCRGKVKSCGKHPITGEKLIWKYYE